MHVYVLYYICTSYLSLFHSLLPAIAYTLEEGLRREKLLFLDGLIYSVYVKVFPSAPSPPQTKWLACVFV